MANTHERAVLNSVFRQWNNPDYSDLIIECEGRQFHVHKFLLCGMSPVFASQCKSRMREGLSGIIIHETFCAKTVERMIQYAYCQTYDVDGEESLFKQADALKVCLEEADSARDDSIGTLAVLLAHVDVFGIGDYYDIPTLRELAVDRFQKVAKIGIHNVDLLELVQQVVMRDNTTTKALLIAFENLCWSLYVEALLSDPKLLKRGWPSR